MAKIRLCLLVLLVIMGGIHSSAVTANVTVLTYSPGFSLSDVDQYSRHKTAESGYIEINPSLDPVVPSGVSISSITSVYGDATIGKLGAYAWLDSPDDNVGETLVATAAASFRTPITFSGFSGTKTVTAELEVHGILEKEYGSPNLVLSSNLTVQTPSEFGTESDIHFYGSSLIFSKDPDTGYETADVTHLQFESIYSSAGELIMESDTYLGASYMVDVNALDEVLGVVKLSFEVVDGQTMWLDTFLSASSTPTGVEESDGSIMWLPSSGTTDALSTGTLRLYAPSGVELAGDPILSNIVTVVPLPSAVWLFVFAVGFTGLVGWKRKKAV